MTKDPKDRYPRDREQGMVGIELRQIFKIHSKSAPALAGVDLTIEPRTLLTMIGRSGAGKTTLLRLIVGLDAPSSGELRIGGVSARDLAPRHREAAMVFQTPALYPHLNVLDNIAFSLRGSGRDRRSSRALAESAADRLGLSAMLRRSPSTLSGGQRQRVALARVLARRPKILLLDEPFASLDAEWRSILRADLRALHEELGMTTIHATHDQAEALALGTRLAILDQGRLIASGPPRELYDRPPSRQAAAMLGDPPMNILDLDRESSRDDPWSVDRPNADVDALGVRPEHLRLFPASADRRPEAGPGFWMMRDWRAERTEDHGASRLIWLCRGDRTLIVRTETIAPRVGELCDAAIPFEFVSWFRRDGSRL